MRPFSSTQAPAPQAGLSLQPPLRGLVYTALTRDGRVARSTGRGAGGLRGALSQPDASSWSGMGWVTDEGLSLWRVRATYTGQHIA